MALTDPVDTHGHTLADVVATYPGFGDAETGAEITLATSAAADDIIDTTQDHGLVAGDLIRFATLTGGTGLSVGTVYKVSATSLAATTFRITAKEGGADLGFSADITAGTVEPYTEVALAQTAAEVTAQIG
jgi:hypothetical protein